MFSANSFTPTAEETVPAAAAAPSWHTLPPPMPPRDPQHPPTAEEIADAAATTRAAADVASTAIKEATVVMTVMHEAGASPEMLAVALDAEHVAQKCAARAVRAATPVYPLAGMAKFFMPAVSPAIKGDPFSGRSVAMTMANAWAGVANKMAAQVEKAAAPEPLPTPPST